MQKRFINKILEKFKMIEEKVSIRTNQDKKTTRKSIKKSQKVN